MARSWRGHDPPGLGLPHYVRARSDRPVPLPAVTLPCPPPSGCPSDAHLRGPHAQRSGTCL